MSTVAERVTFRSNRNENSYRVDLPLVSWAGLMGLMPTGDRHPPSTSSSISAASEVANFISKYNDR